MRQTETEWLSGLFYLITYAGPYENSPDLLWWNDRESRWITDRAQATRYSPSEARQPIAQGTGRWVGPCDGSET